MANLTKKQEKIAENAIEKVNEWIARGTEIKKIQNTIQNHWGINSAIKNETLTMVMYPSVSDGRGGRRFARQVIIAEIKL